MKKEENDYLYNLLKKDGLTELQIKKRMKSLRDEISFTKMIIKKNRKNKETNFKEEFNKLKFL